MSSLLFPTIIDEKDDNYDYDDDYDDNDNDNDAADD